MHDLIRKAATWSLAWSVLISSFGCSDTHAEAPSAIDMSDLASNLPAGMTLVTDNPFPADFIDWDRESAWRDPVTGAYWGIATNREGELPSIVSDPTAPSGSGLVFQQSYAGVRDGHEPKFPSTGLGNGLEVFIAMHVKFDPRWQNPRNSGIKWHIVNAMQNGTSQSAGWFGTGREVGGPAAMVDEPNQGFVFNGTCARGDCGIPESPRAVRFQLRPSLGTGLMSRGTWHKVQYYLSKNPGVVRIWVDDVLIVDHTGFAWSDPSGAWQSFQMGATWGGGVGYPAPPDNRVFYDRVIIWRR